MAPDVWRLMGAIIGGQGSAEGLIKLGYDPATFNLLSCQELQWLKPKKGQAQTLGPVQGPGIFFRTPRPNEDIFTSDMQVGIFDEMRRRRWVPLFSALSDFVSLALFSLLCGVARGKCFVELPSKKKIIYLLNDGVVENEMGKEKKWRKTERRMSKKEMESTIPQCRSAHWSSLWWFLHIIIPRDQSGREKG